VLGADGTVCVVFGDFNICAITDSDCSTARPHKRLLLHAQPHEQDVVAVDVGVLVSWRGSSVTDGAAVILRYFHLAKELGCKWLNNWVLGCHHPPKALGIPCARHLYFQMEDHLVGRFRHAFIHESARHERTSRDRV
jgi:hypothetical protein